jgi:hypothetical protein
MDHLTARWVRRIRAKGGGGGGLGGQHENIAITWRPLAIEQRFCRRQDHKWTATGGEAALVVAAILKICRLQQQPCTEGCFWMIK